MRAFLIATALVLGGCASQSSALKYTRTDNRSVDAAQEQATLGQCEDEAATTAVQVNGALERARKEAAVVDACMARNGYVQVPQQ